MALPARGAALTGALADQVERLVQLGYPALVGRSEDDFRSWLQPLEGSAPEGPSVLVVPAEAERALPLARPSRGTPFVDLRPRTSRDFRPLPGLGVPEEEPYIVVAVDTGAEHLDVTPEAALIAMRAAGRSPLTIEEGVALLLQRPDVLEERNAFSLPGSRGADQRVPALWTSRLPGRRGPRLGWCWDRNPHPWLGSASCGGRLTAAG